VVVNVFLTSTTNTTPASYDAMALVTVKPRKRQRLADPLLQSGVVTSGGAAIRRIRRLPRVLD